MGAGPAGPGSRVSETTGAGFRTVPAISHPVRFGPWATLPVDSPAESLQTSQLVPSPDLGRLVISRRMAGGRQRLGAP